VLETSGYRLCTIYHEKTSLSDSVIYIKAHTYKSIAERLTDADKDDGTRINKNWKKKCKTILKLSTVLYCTVLKS